MSPLQILRSPEHSLLCSPIGLMIIDSFTQGQPLAPVRLRVDLLSSVGWLETPLRPTQTPSGMVTLPGLGRCADAASNAVRHTYRLRIEAIEYIADYRRDKDGFEFPVPPYDDLNPPAIPPASARALQMHPSSSYPYDGSVRVVRGRVRVANQSPVRDALIRFGVDRAMTDERGEFAIALRRAPRSGPVTIDVDHDRSGRSQSFTLQLPAALRTNQLLTL